MRPILYVAGVLSAIHLLLVGMGASQVPIPLPGNLQTISQYYGSLSGANTGYAFFAPGVQSQLRARFIVEKEDGKLETTDLFEKQSRETELRMNSAIGTMWEKVSDERVRRSIAASLAAKVVSRFPGARTVEVNLEAYDLPPMESYRKGDRPQWEPFYSAKFSLQNAAAVSARSSKGAPT